MDDCQMLTSVSKITPACTHITELLCQQVFIYNEEKLTVHHIHHVLKRFSCHKAIFVVTGQ